LLNAVPAVSNSTDGTSAQQKERVRSTQRLLIRQGDVLTLEFTVAGVPCIGLNSGPAFEHNDFFPVQIATMIRTRPTATGTPL
jgi:predicted 3-demethylubiquinone-9 3-methyltransferase (glyoxalase superfamily)